MGGSAIGGLLARAALGDRASRRSRSVATTGCRPGRRPTRPSCARATRATPRRRWRRSRPPARSARGGSSARPAASWPQQARADGVPVIPRARRVPAPRRGRLHARRGARGRGAGRRRRGAAHRDRRRRRRTPRRWPRAWGPDAPEDSLAKSLARKLHGTVPEIIGPGLTAPIAYRWKTQINENAKTPAFVRRAARARPQRARRLDRRIAAGALRRPSSSTTPTCIRGSASGSS